MPSSRPYRVVWSRQAAQALAAIWSGAGSVMRNDVTTAQHLLDQSLGVPAPEKVGHAVSSWFPRSRYTVQYPLRVWFTVDPGQKEVVIKKVELDAQPLFPSTP